jgi:Na+/H+ antiporter NhaC
MKPTGTHWRRSALQVLPLVVFLLGAILLAYKRCPDEKGYWPLAVLALALAVLPGRDRQLAAESAIAGMSQPIVAIMLCAWILASTLGQFLHESGVVDVLAQAVVEAGLVGGSYVAICFLISSVVATGTGTAVGTILLCTPVLFPVGAMAQADPSMLLGAILAGGAFGDDFSPLSDTTVASANSQGVEIADAVNSRLKYVLPAAAAAFTLYFVLGGGASSAETPARELRAAPASASLLMLLAPAAVVVLCLRRAHILVALLTGICTASVIGLLSGDMEPGRLFSLDPESFGVRSIFIDGMSRGVGISVLTLLLMGTTEVVLTRMHSIWGDTSATSLSPRSAEMRIAGAILGTNVLLAHNTVTILATAPLIRSLRSRGRLSGLRTTQLVDISANTVMHMLPYMITVIVAISGARPDMDLYPQSAIEPIRVGLHNFHSIGLLVVLAVVVTTGLWRTRASDLEGSRSS